jgi:hypothetical protein
LIEPSTPGPGGIVGPGSIRFSLHRSLTHRGSTFIPTTTTTRRDFLATSGAAILATAALATDTTAKALAEAEFNEDCLFANAARHRQCEKLAKRRVFFVTVGAYEQGSTCRRGLTVDDVIREQLDDMGDGLEYALKRGRKPAPFAADEDDTVIGDGGKIAAVITTRRDGKTIVTRFEK